MKVQSIKIKNFKAIEEKEIKFTEQVTALIGDNATGKSSILDAISIGLGTFLMKTNASFGFNGKKTRPLLTKEIRKIHVSEDNIEYSDVLLSGEFEFEDQNYNWLREQKTTSKSLTYQHAKDLTELGKNLSSQLTEDINLPLIAYHSTARLAGQIHEKTAYEKVGSRLDGYYACLDPRSIKQKFISWFKTYEDSILKFDKDKSLYIAFTNAISSMVENWTDIKYNWSLDDIVGKNHDNNWIPLSNLSDGYRGVINLAADIAYRAIKLNPHLKLNAVTETEGIVLIDELDMHLHPKWQKTIINDLKRTFPKIQFIITSHSPFIIQSLNYKEVVSLDTNSIEGNPINKSIEEIAEEEMNVLNTKRSQEFMNFQNLASEYFNLIKQGKSSQSDEETKQIKSQLDDIELNFIKDPVYLALLKAERQTEM